MKLPAKILLASAALAASLSPAAAMEVANEAQVRELLEQLAAGHAPEVTYIQWETGSRDASEPDLALAFEKARDCKVTPLGLVPLLVEDESKPEIAVNLDCGEAPRYGFIFYFDGETLTQIELRPGGIFFVPPPAPKAWAPKGN